MLVTQKRPLQDDLPSIDNIYVQPGQQYPLLGTIVPVNNTGFGKDEKNFDDEIGDQHDHNTYLALLGAPTLPASIP